MKETIDPETDRWHLMAQQQHLYNGLARPADFYFARECTRRVRVASGMDSSARSACWLRPSWLVYGYRGWPVASVAPLYDQRVTPSGRADVGTGRHQDGERANGTNSGTRWKQNAVHSLQRGHKSQHELEGHSAERIYIRQRSFQWITPFYNHCSR